jgi:two-component system sensor kinase FixL
MNETSNENLLETFLSYSSSHRSQVLFASGFLFFLIALLDWVLPPVSLGLLYIVPTVMASSLLTRRQILISAMAYSVFREMFGSTNWHSGWEWRLITGFLGFAAAGLSIAELNRLRLAAVQLLEEREIQSRLRLEAEERLRVLVETSPLAIITLDQTGGIVLANESAQRMLDFDGEPLTGKDVRPFLPVLARPLERRPGGANLRTLVECRGQRKNGEMFLAHIWFSTYTGGDGPAVAAVIWDASESVRDREDADLNSMFDISHILIGAMSHELRNLAHAAVAAYDNLASLPGLNHRKEFASLRTIVTALEKMAASGLQIVSGRRQSSASLYNVLDEARIVLQPSFEESQIEVSWSIAEGIPLVQADHHRLLQVFLNLARNSCREMAACGRRVIEVTAAAEGEMVSVRFQDSGPGVSDPANLFRPFQMGAHESGLGLYVSREILRSHGGDLRYEHKAEGACFLVELWPVDGEREG